MSPETEGDLRDPLRGLQEVGRGDGPDAEDALVDKLLESNPEFQAKVAASKVCPRKPFNFGRRG
jgi:hypothetical protein